MGEGFLGGDPLQQRPPRRATQSDWPKHHRSGPKEAIRAPYLPATQKMFSLGLSTGDISHIHMPLSSRRKARTNQDNIKAIA